MRWICGFLVGLMLSPMTLAGTFKAGYAERDVTPPAGLPMWGYGARHDLPATGTRNPLFCKTVVIDTGNGKLALMGLDIGRGPTFAMTDRILKAVKEKAGIEYVFMSGSHTHHGPVIELLDKPGLGQGKFDNVIEYTKVFEQKLTDCILDAAAHTVDAKIGWASAETDLNRNRHTKKEPKPRDAELAVIRVDKADGTPLAFMVNFAAHATILDIFDRRWSSEWPGQMQDGVKAALGAPCLFLQGSAGDMSPNTNDQRKGIEGFGKAMADKVVEINKALTTKMPEHPSVRGIYDNLSYKTRIDLNNPAVKGALKMAFFPEMLAMMEELPNGTINPRMETVVLDGELALVGGSGEFFCQHSNRLKKDSAAPETFFIGYCNGHCMYFPTREGIAEGGYGADPTVSWVPEGTGEEMIDLALKNIKTLLEKR